MTPPRAAPARFESATAQHVEGLIGSSEFEPALQILLRVQPHDAVEIFDHGRLLALVFSRMGRFAEALPHARRALDQGTGITEGRRASARWVLGIVLMRLGEGTEAERQFEEALKEVRLGGSDSGTESQILMQLGMIHRQRGSLSIAASLYQQAMRLVESSTNDLHGLRARRNLTLALVHRADYEGAYDLITQVGARGHVFLDPDDRALFELTRALYFLHVGDLDSCDTALALAGELTNDLARRTRVILGEYRGDLLIARGRPTEAIAPLESLLEEVREHIPGGDLVPEIERRLATALLASGRPEDALAHAIEASRAGQRADKLEWAAGLRIAGLCHHALEQPAAALAAFSEALAVLETTEFLAERQRLDSAMAGLAGTPPPTATQPQSRRPRPKPLLLKLRGRELLTFDHELGRAIEVAALGRLPVLIVGETGTGKELVARLLHERGPRPGGPFVAVNCAALTESLAEGELFGASRGSYTGAVRDREGLLAAAHGGTLLLDELPDLSAALQAKLLRVTEDGTYLRIGETTTRQTDARIVAATNRDPQRLVASNQLRVDLYYRLNAHRITLPPLRDRQGDIELLADYFARACGLSGVSAEVLAWLRSRTWPGNVRELKLLVETAAAHTAPGAPLDLRTLDRIVGQQGTALVERSQGQSELLSDLMLRHSGN